MLRIGKSSTADTRSCDFANVSRDTLKASSEQHIGDVRLALGFFAQLLHRQAAVHDVDKLTDLDSFHAEFVTGFAQTAWWERHRSLNRHHLTHADGVPADVNLIDVLDFIADCVMAGMARSGSMYPLELPPELLNTAFQNTVTLLKRAVHVDATEVPCPAKSQASAPTTRSSKTTTTKATEGAGHGRGSDRARSAGSRARKRRSATRSTRARASSTR